MEDGKSRRYFKYALGEVVLVVIGILIALQINNWNEHRKSKQALAAIYNTVVEDLKSDILEIQYILDATKPKQIAIDKILDGNMTEAEFRDCTPCLDILNGYPDWAVDTRGYNLLNNFVSATDGSQSNLQMKITQFYTRYRVEFEGDDILRMENLKKNIFYFEKNTTWYADFMTSRDFEGYIQYALNDQDFKNRIATYYILHFSIYTPILEEFIRDAELLIEEISKNET